MTLSTVFGIKPDNAIYNPSTPYNVRFNCQVGQVALSETEFLDSEVEISIVKVSRYFGTLGNTKNVEWFQIFYIPAPSCKALPSNTVCCSYIKTRSVGAFQQTVTRLMGSGVNPAEGIFKLSFQKHQNGDRNYFSVVWNWRARKGKPETDQLNMVAAFMDSTPQLSDLSGTRQMLCVDDLSSLLVQEMIHEARLYPDFTPQEILTALTTNTLATR